MSRYLRSKFENLEPYTPGEQLDDTVYIKLNTNESPYTPGIGKRYKLNRYSDHTCGLLREKIAELYGVSPANVVCGNGSDEILYLAFNAFFDKAAFPDVTYGFYKVFADGLGIEKKIIPLNADYRIDPADYRGIDAGIAIANPNAQTGIALSLDEIEEIVKSNPDNVVIVDEAYVDFGAESAVPLTEIYDNLLVVMTFSKSRSLAGARLGFAIGNVELINDLNTLRYSMNPYNVSTVTQDLGIRALENNERYMENAREIAELREYVCEMLSAIGYRYLPSSANFILITKDDIPGERIYTELKEKGILVRYFGDEERLKDYVRVTVGSRKQMLTFLDKLEEIR